MDSHNGGSHLGTLTTNREDSTSASLDFLHQTVNETNRFVLVYNLFLF